MRNTVLILWLALSATLHAQAGLKLSKNTWLVATGNPSIVVSGTDGHITLDSNSNASLDGARIYPEGNWKNHGAVQAGTSTLFMNGNVAQTIQHHNGPLYNLSIDNASGIQMLNSFAVDHEVSMHAGILNTGAGDTLLLGTSGSLVNEGNGKYVAGHVQCLASLNAGSISPGNAGITMQSTENLGTTTVTRSSGLFINDLSYATFPLDNALSIDRIWNVQTSATPTVPVTYQLQWLSDNDHGVNLSATQLWHKETQWDTVGTSALNAGTRTLTFEDLRTGMFTVGKSYIVAFVVSANADTTCAGNATVINDLSQLTGTGYTYQWDFQNDGIVDQTTTGNTSYRYPAAGTYQAKLIITNSIGQKDSSFFPVVVYETPVVDAGNDVEIDYKGSTLLNAGISPDVVSHNWTPAASLNDATIASPLASPVYTTVYHVTNSNGCEASDSVKVSVKLFIPTGFTPDGDGTNDVWEIPALESFPDATIKVYDRSGQPVFTGGSNNYWDGTFNGRKSPSEAYYYIIDLGDDSDALSGYVSIIRLKK